MREAVDDHGLAPVDLIADEIINALYENTDEIASAAKSRLHKQAPSRRELASLGRSLTSHPMWTQWIDALAKRLA